MKIAEKKIGQQIRFWSLIGPWAIFLSLLVYLFKFSNQSLLVPSAGIIGVALCWKYRVKGLFAAIGVLGFVTAFTLIYLTALDPMWVLGAASSFAVGFVITTLAADEVDNLLTMVDPDSLPFMAQMGGVEHKIKEIRDQHAKEAAELQESLSEKNDQIYLFEQRCQELQNQLMASQQELLEEQNAHLKTQHSVKDLEALLSQRPEFSEEQIMNDAILKEMGDLVDSLNKEKKELEEIIEQRNHELSELREQFDKQILMIEMQQDTALTLQEAKMQSEDALQQQKSAFLDKQRAFEEKEFALQQQLEQWKQQYHQAQEQLSEWHQKLNEYYALQARVKELDGEVSKLSKERTQLMQDLNQAVAERDALLVSPPPAADEEELKQTKGMLKQLRMQFEEKTSTLDATRRELFYAQHRIDVVQREIVEKVEYDREGILKAYERHILRMEKCYNEDLEHYEKVIDLLESQIGQIEQ